MKKNDKSRTGARASRPPPAASRKPPAPHGHPLTRSKPEDRVHPAERKAKHKSRPGRPRGQPREAGQGAEPTSPTPLLHGN